MEDYELRALESYKRNKKNGCWEWTGTLRPDGYGQLSYNYKKIRAHRILYKIFNGDIPDGMSVLHKCDNRKCVNPDHLFLGTHDDNMADMASKGRSALGPRNSHYGQKWIFNDKLKQNKTVDSDDVNHWLNQGWSLGIRVEYHKNKNIEAQMAGVEVATGELMSASRLNEYRKNKKVTYRNLAEISGFSTSYLCEMFNQRKKMTESMYHKLKAYIDSIS